MYEGKEVKSVTFIVTHQCNLRCSYCYEHNKNEARMSVETAKRAVDHLFECDINNNIYINPQNADCLILDFIGGEPLLEIELIDTIVDYFREKAILLDHRWATQYMISMSTNGLNYFEPKVQEFLQKNEGRVSMGITLDGDKETHDTCRLDCAGCGSYDRAAAAFADGKDIYGQNGTKFTIAPENVQRVFIACKDMIERFNLNSLYCNCVYEEGWTEEHAKVLYTELKKLADFVIETKRYNSLYLSIFEEYIGKPATDSPSDDQNWCGGTGKMLAVDVDGSFYPCLRYSPLSIGDKLKPIIIGNIDRGIGIDEEDIKVINMLNSITRTSQSTEECINCPIAKGCGWCSAYNYEVTGTPNKRVTYICPTHKARVMATCYYWNTIYRLEGLEDRFSMNVPKEWAIPIVGEEEYNKLVELAKED